MILITNDDGYNSKGINTLIELAKPFGKILVVAPDTPRSAQSSALTVAVPVTCNEICNEENLRIVACSGTPADCVKFALCSQFPNFEGLPDIVLSGINHGANSSINVMYSGTMGATIEGTLYNIPSIGFSICDHNLDADFSICKKYFSEIIKDVLENGLPQGVCLNVNAPVGEIRGVKYCRQARGTWENEFLPSAAPLGRKCYWMTGDFINEEPQAADTDEYALANGFISIQPVQTDFTDYGYLKTKS
ncbi:MAG: 5'/3'-nucleotidase SurE [Prevotellaceae bacterium]|jgi:5'-nucleotidase|nr:5'/3'-nucleotidase SurE [Prevotellaceae bacterium]